MKRTVSEYGEIFTIILQGREKEPNKKTEILKRKSGKIYLIIGSNLFRMF